MIANENVNIQSSNNTFQGHPPQILENSPSSTTAMNHRQMSRPLIIATIKMEMIPQERPATSEPTGITFGKIIASIKKVLKTTKSLNQKEQLL